MVFEDNMDLDRLRLEKTKEILQAELWQFQTLVYSIPSGSACSAWKAIW